MGAARGVAHRRTFGEPPFAVNNRARDQLESSSDAREFYRCEKQDYLAPGTISNWPVSRISSEPEPIITLNLPGSTTKCI